ALTSTCERRSVPAVDLDLGEVLVLALGTDHDAVDRPRAARQADRRARPMAAERRRYRRVEALAVREDDHDLVQCHRFVGRQPDGREAAELLPHRIALTFGPSFSRVEVETEVDAAVGRHTTRFGGIHDTGGGGAGERAEQEEESK